MPSNSSGSPSHGPSELGRALTTVAEQSQRLVQDFLNHQITAGTLGLTDMRHLSRAFVDMNQQLVTDPVRLAEAQLTLWQDYLELWQHSAAAWLGQPGFPTTAPVRPGDAQWPLSFIFDFIKRCHLLTVRWLQRTISGIDGLDDRTRRKLDFYTDQFIDALSPTCGPLSNPQLLRITLDAGGVNLLQGLRHLLTDLEQLQDRLGTDPDGFVPGRDIAVTPGQVVYQNELIQLIQYQPTTAQVFRRPLLIVPPWINRYYILDLQPENSFVKWCVDQGFTVFVISWVDPDEHLAEEPFEDYLKAGTLAALAGIEQACGEREVNLVGYCLGGTLLACTAAYLSGQGDHRVQSCSYFATLLDFEQPGELEVFIDEEELTALEQQQRRHGNLNSSATAVTFNMLRANDLIWSFFVNNYLQDREPFPLDLLYWNSDTTRIPAAMHGFYLRNMYQNNLLKEPGGITLLGKPIDLGRITAPTCIVATLDDHLAPWQSIYAGTRLFGGPVRFMLGSSGHIAGVVNSPSSVRYGYWTRETLPEAAADWLSQAECHPGSWWNDWRDWITTHAGEPVTARIPGTGRLEPIEPAPGSYVLKPHPVGT